jgi:hypothetical protein
MIKFMTGYETVTYLSTKNYTTLHFVASLFASKGRGNYTPLLLSHPNINLPTMEEHAITLRLVPKRHLCFSFSWAVMENIALWLKKCLLMQLMTRKSELRLLMATG